MIKIYSNNRFKKGFGLLEVVLATGVLITVISSSVFLNRLIVRNSVLSLDRTEAYNLAQQGIEGVRAIRDTNWLVKDPWYNGLDFSDSESNSDAWNLVQDNQGFWKLRKYNENSDQINLNNIDYRRKIFILRPEDVVNSELNNRSGGTIDNSSGDQFRKVKVVVEWESYGQTWKVETEEYIGDWKPTF